MEYGGSNGTIAELTAYWKVISILSQMTPASFIETKFLTVHSLMKIPQEEVVKERSWLLSLGQVGKNIFQPFSSLVSTRPMRPRGLENHELTQTSLASRARSGSWTLTRVLLVMQIKEH